MSNDLDNKAAPSGPPFADNGPGAEALERGRKMFAGRCDFVMGGVSLDNLPQHGLVEVAFTGRSNVGKSSLVNALTGRKTLARTSNTPGRTQELNFFRLGENQDGDEGLMLVDLPGYGFARAPKDTVARWTKLVLSYLKGRPQLRRVCVLVDARHGLKPTDIEVMDMLDQAAVNYQVILTKADKLTNAEARACFDTVNARVAKRVAAYPEVLMTSAKTGDGIAEVRARLAELAYPDISN